MGIKVLISDPDRDRLELETISNHIGMNLFCQFIQDAQNLLFIVGILLKGGVPAD